MLLQRNPEAAVLDPLIHSLLDRIGTSTHTLWLVRRCERHDKCEWPLVPVCVLIVLAMLGGVRVGMLLGNPLLLR